MIGDNPETDIRGANDAGDHWTSVLVRTGVFQVRANGDDSKKHSLYMLHKLWPSQGGDNSLTHPARSVQSDVGSAVEWILAREGISP